MCPAEERGRGAGADVDLGNRAAAGGEQELSSGEAGGGGSGQAGGGGPADAVRDGLTRLGFSLHGVMPPDRNAVFAPVSIGLALHAVLAGARGRTADQTAHLLGVPAHPDGPLQAAGALLSRLNPRHVDEDVWDEERGAFTAVRREAFRLSLATGLFVQPDYPLHAAYRELLQATLDASVRDLAFGDAGAAAEAVNAWVREHTGGRIPRLLEPESIDPLTRLVLANAVHFKAEWAEPFEESATRPGPFHVPGSGAPADVPMMHQVTSHAYWEEPGGAVRAARLPYRGGAAMVVVLPAEGRFGEVERRLSPDLLARVDQEANPRTLDLALPRFQFESSLSLKPPLEALGMRDAFDRDHADLGGITSSPEGLVVSEAVHSARVEVDERGTEAAAATAVVFAALGMSAEPERPLPFVVDRPFFFFIVDDRTGVLLFMGRVTDPRDLAGSPPGGG